MPLQDTAPADATPDVRVRPQTQGTAAASATTRSYPRSERLTAVGGQGAGRHTIDQDLAGGPISRRNRLIAVIIPKIGAISSTLTFLFPPPRRVESPVVGAGAAGGISGIVDGGICVLAVSAA